MLGDARIDAAVEAAGRGLSILVIRLGAMGDIVRTLPAVRLVRFALPDARLHWAAWAPWSELLDGHPEIDGVIELPRSRLRRLAASPPAWPRLARELGGIAAAVRGLGAGLVLDFHGDLRSGLLGRVSGARVRLGYSGHQQKEGNKLFTTHRVAVEPRRRSRIERNLALVRALGLPSAPLPDAGLAIPEAAERSAAEIAEELAAPGGAYAVLGPGASRRQAYKKPPAHLFAAAAGALAERGVRPIVAAGPGEEADAAGVVEAARGAARCAPPTSLMTLAALLRGARLFVGGDTGPLHLACGVGCPVVGLYGPTDPVVNAPWNVPNAALSPEGRAYTGIKAQDRAAGGFEGLAPDAVARAVAGVLAAARAEAP
jgi:ADP-heptose:LPS heptosyltransferase